MGRVDIGALEERCGLTFRDKELIEAALIHSSAELGVSNERLEFLGDAVLQLVVSRHLYTRFPSFDEGKLTKLRARVVNKKTLAQVALRSHIDGLLLLGESLKKAEKAPNPSILADAYEAVIGAIYLDRGMNVVRKFIRLTLLKELGNIQVDRDFKSELQEEAIKRFKCYPEYNLLRIEGPEHAKKFWVEVKVGGRRFGSGKGLSRKEAEKAAAKRALRNWRRPVAKEQRR